MPRYFVHVNINPDRKHITVHKESNSPCPNIFLHTKAGGAHADNFPIQDINNSGAFKTAEKPNGYWLILWAPNPEAVHNNPLINGAAKELEVPIEYCLNCL